jgi:hypothetical protein
MFMLRSSLAWFYEETFRWGQLVWQTFDAGARFASLPDEQKETYTPQALLSALQSASLDGGYERLGAQLETSKLLPTTIYTSPRSVDPNTCVITPARSVQMMKHRIDDMSISCLVNAVQPRHERLSVTVRPGISDFGGQVEELTQTSYMLDVESRAESVAVMSYETDRGLRQFSRRGVSSSVYYSGGEFRSSNADVVRALASKAARVALERAHCVRLTIDTTAEAIIDIDLRDRVRIVDARLPGGQATGKVIGWDVEFGSSETGQLVLMCPVSTGDGDVAELNVDMIEIEGDVSIDTTPTMAAVRSGNAMSLVTMMEVIDPAVDQDYVIGGTDEGTTIDAPESRIPQTGIALELADLTPADYDDLETTEIKLAPFELILPRGITL